MVWAACIRKGREEAESSILEEAGVGVSGWCESAVWHDEGVYRRIGVRVVPSR